MIEQQGHDPLWFANQPVFGILYLLWYLASGHPSIWSMRVYIKKIDVLFQSCSGHKRSDEERPKQVGYRCQWMEWFWGNFEDRWIFG